MLELGRRHGLVAAAAQAFHDDLNIDRPQTAGGNIHTAPHLHGHKAGLHILDGQQVVGSLRNGNTGLGGHLAAHRDGTVAVHLGSLHKVCLGVVLHHGHIKELAHPLRLRTVAAQSGGSFKRAHAGVQGEVPGIQHTR